MTPESTAYSLDLANLPIGAVVVDSEDTVVSANERACRLLVQESAALTGARWSQVISGTEDPTSSGFVAVRATGSGAMVSVCAVPASDDSSTLWLVSDYAEDPWLETGLVSLQRYYQRGAMSGDIAHEINNFLAIIQGNVELMPLLLRKGDEEKIEHKLDLMKRSCEKITKLCDGFMDMCEDEPRMMPCNVNHVVQHALQFLTPQNMFDDVEVTTNLSDEIPLVQADPGLLQQAVINLLINAATAVADCESPVVTAVTELTGEDSQAVCISISDNGSGVLASLESGLLKRRVSTSDHQLGLGLLVAQRILKAHDGGVDISSGDSGTTVRLSFPVRTVETDQPQVSTSASGSH